MPVAAAKKPPSKKFDAGDWTAVEPRFDALERDPAKDLKSWLARFSDLAAALAEEENRRYVAMTCHTDDPEKEKAHLFFQTEILPKCKPRWQALKKKLVGHPKRKGLPAIYRVFLQHTKNEIEIFRDENVPIEAKEAELQQQYQKVCGAMTVTFDGREQTLPMMAKYLEETDRAKRQAAWETTVRRRLQDRETIDKMFDELIALRTKIATNAGFANYRDYAFRMRGRFDYTPEDCLRFHDAVEKRVVPALRERHRIRARKLGVDPLRPWDLSVDPLGRPPLRPFEKTRDLIDGCRRIFHKVDPDFAKKFDAFRKRGYLDLESRKGKAPGGYMSVFDVERMPFIFMNAAGRQDDVETLLHEGGHSFHSLLAAKHDFLFHRNYPIEFAEVASMGMELLGAPYLGEFYEEEEARRAVEYHLEFLLTLFPWICSIDAFQHQVYQGADRQKAWIEIRDRFQGAVDWTGLDEARAYEWQRQSHLFTVPFYYIEYAVAQMGALQVWLNARKNRRQAIAKYRAGLSLGWTRPLPELFKSAGLKWDFSERTLAPLIDAVMKELG
ncbi:MAG: M3 family oligoendopeptidase [Planctomycetes bacterium]|nr:M3 family oligoendopeptidase [Planctomycetota bacterium]